MNDQLKKLRILYKMTQEELAEKMNVSRQSIAKWESGESVPDMIKCNELAKVFQLEIEDIANIFIPERESQKFRPKNKYIFGISKIINQKIILPQEALDTFGLQNGDELIILGDITQGIAIIPKRSYTEFLEELMNLDVLGDDENENSH